MERVIRMVAALAVGYGIYSTHDLWLLQRTEEACHQATISQADSRELMGAQRICSAAGVDVTPMLRKIFPQAPRK